MHELMSALVIFLAIGTIMWLRANRRSRGAGDPRLPSEREDELEREVEDLRQRIAVLERIATDERKSRDIAAEIEALRE